MPKGSYSGKQRKLAAVAPPRDKITSADFKKLNHTAQHMRIMKEEMLNGKTFMQAHAIAMRKKGK